MPGIVRSPLKPVQHFFGHIPSVVRQPTVSGAGCFVSPFCQKNTEIKTVFSRLRMEVDLEVFLWI
jgi:hypothetical protein